MQWFHCLLPYAYSGQVIEMQFCIPADSHVTVSVLNDLLTRMYIYVFITKEVKVLMRGERLIYEIKITSLLV